jgi:hypothetical protein
VNEKRWFKKRKIYFFFGNFFYHLVSEKVNVDWIVSADRLPGQNSDFRASFPGIFIQKV